MKKKKHIILMYLSFPVLLIIGLTLVRDRPKGWLKEGRVKSSPEALTNWARAPFTPIEGGADFRNKLENTPITTTNCVLTANQKEQLYMSAYNMLMASHLGSYEAYTAFVYPITNGIYDAQITNFRQDKLRAMDPQWKTGVSTTPESTAERWWHFWNEVESTPRYTNYLCTKCLKYASLEKATFLVETQNKLPQPLNHYVTSFDNFGYVQHRPSFIFTPSPKEVLHKKGELTLAIVSIIVKNEYDSPYPIFCRYYWADDYEKWLPIEFCTAFSPSRKYDFLF